MQERGQPVSSGLLVPAVHPAVVRVVVLRRLWPIASLSVLSDTPGVEVQGREGVAQILNGMVSIPSSAMNRRNLRLTRAGLSATPGLSSVTMMSSTYAAPSGHCSASARGRVRAWRGQLERSVPRSRGRTAQLIENLPARPAPDVEHELRTGRRKQLT